MLRTRVITAVVLLALLLPVVDSPLPWPFPALTLVFIAAAGWEWSRLNGLAGSAAVGLGLAVAAFGGLLWWGEALRSLPPAFWASIALLWIVGGGFALRGGVEAWGRSPVGLRMALGFAVLLTAWLALVLARQAGINHLLSVLCLVWMADIAAYFGGKTFGRHKLAPTISPGKTWEGAVSGALGVLVLGLFWMAWVDHQPWVDSRSIYSTICNRWGWVLGFAAGALLLCAMSVVGDLFESLIKRSVGAKDSSRLLPGHGGVLDRIDALLPTLPVAQALLMLGAGAR